MNELVAKLTSPPGVLPPDYTQLVTLSTDQFTRAHIATSYRDDSGLLPQSYPTPNYLHSLRLLNDDMYLTAYPSLPPRSHDLSHNQLLSHMASFPYSPINDFDLNRNIYTKHFGFEATPSLLYRSTTTMPQSHEINALRHYQRKLLQQRTENIPNVKNLSSEITTPILSISPPPTTTISSPLFQVVESAFNTLLPPSTKMDTSVAAVAAGTATSLSSLSPRLQEENNQIDPHHRSAYDSVGAHIFSPSIFSPHLYSYALGSTPSTGAQFSSTIAIKNKLLCHLLLKQNPQEIPSDQSQFNPVASVSQTLTALTNTTPSADFVLLAQITPRTHASVRFYDIGAEGIGQAALSLGCNVKNHNVNFTIQSRPTYLFLSQFSKPSLSSSSTASPTNASIPGAATSQSLCTSPQFRHPSDSLVDALSAGLNHECPYNVRNDISSWRLSGDTGLTPLERMILDKPVLHLTMTRNVQPLLTSSLQARAWCGLRLSASSYYPHWVMSQRNPTSTTPPITSNLQSSTSLTSSTSSIVPSHTKPFSQEPSLLDSYYPTTPLGPPSTLVDASIASTQPQPHTTIPHASLSNLLSSIGTVYVQKSPTNIFTFETTDSLSSLRASYTHFLDPHHTIHNPIHPPSAQSSQKQPSTLTNALFTTLPTLTASVSIEMNLKQLRASQVALYEQYHYHQQKKHLEYLRQMTMDYLQSVGSGPKTPVINAKPQPQPHALPLPTIPLAQTHPYLLSSTAFRALLHATTTELSNTYFVQTSLAYNFSHAAQVCLSASSHGDLSLNSVLSTHPTFFSKCADLCPTCNHLRCSCFQGLDPFGIPAKFNIGIKTNLNSVSPIHDTSISFSTTIGHM